jgi:hypothetical protein
MRSEMIQFNPGVPDAQGMDIKMIPASFVPFTPHLTGFVRPETGESTPKMPES